MVALNFPNNPTLNQVFVNWRWDGNRWVVLPSGGGGASVTISATPPTGASLGDLWWDEVGGQLYVLDANNQWVIVVNPAALLDGGTQPKTTVSNTAPSNPNNGDLWLNTSVDPPMLMVWNQTANAWQLSTTAPTGFLPLGGGILSSGGTLSQILSMIEGNGVPVSLMMVTGGIAAWYIRTAANGNFEIASQLQHYLRVNPTGEVNMSGSSWTWSGIGGLSVGNGITLHTIDNNFYLGLSGGLRVLSLAASTSLSYNPANATLSLTIPQGTLWQMRGSDNLAFNPAGPIGAYGTFTNFLSWRRVKDNIRPITNAIQRVLRFKPKAYCNKHTNKEELGFLIDDLIDDCPECITKGPDGKPEGYAESMLVPALTAALQELIARVGALETEITICRNK